MFLRQSTVGREPLAIAMSGVRMGERTAPRSAWTRPLVTSLLAAKPGLSGESSMVVADEATAAQARRAVAESGALVEHRGPRVGCPPVRRRFVRPGRRPQPDRTDSEPWLRRIASALGECRRVLRSGGRVSRARKGHSVRTDGDLSVSDRSGPDRQRRFGLSRPQDSGRSRTLGDRDGYRFVEGLKTRGPADTAARARAAMTC